MAVVQLTGPVRSVQPTGVAAGVDAAAGLESLERLGPLMLELDGPATMPLGAAPVVPVSKPPAFSAAARVGGFVDDFYYRVHVRPGVLDLGNLLSSQTRDVEVWNAHLEAKELEEVTSTGLDGVTLDQPEEPPTTFGALESRVYRVSIGITGAPTVSGFYVFDFGDEQPTLRISGRRVVVWPFIPQTKFREGLEWRTDVMRAYSAEQRLALREAPRQSLMYEHQLDRRQLAQAQAMAFQWAHRVFGVPVWGELTRLGALAAPTQRLEFDTSGADYRSADILLVWQDDENYLAAETLTVDASGVDLKVPLGRAFENAYVMPLRYGRTPGGLSFSRRPDHVSLCRADFLVTNNVDLGADVGLPQYRGRDVLMDRSVTLDDLAERTLRPVDEFDNGSGPISVDPQRSIPDVTATIGLDALTRQDAWRMRRWLHARRGRQRTFWLPTWNADLVVLEDVDEAATSLVVRPIGYPLYYGVTDIMLVLNDGTALYNRVLSGATDTSGNEVLSLADGFGRSFAASDVELACLMRHVRLDSDNAQLTHGYAGRCSCSLPVIEVPEGD